MAYVALVAIFCGCGAKGTKGGSDGAIYCENEDQCPPGYTCEGNICVPDTTGDAAVDASGAPDLTVDPDPVDFGSPVLGGEYIQNVTLGNAGATDLIISDLQILEQDSVPEYSLQQVDLPITLGPGEEQDVGIALRTVDAELDQAQLIISSNDPAEPTRLVPLNTSHKGEAELEVCVLDGANCVDPPALDFGQLSYGIPATLTFFVRNIGDGNAVIWGEDIKFSSTSSETAGPYSLVLYTLTPDPNNPAQQLETAIVRTDLPFVLSPGDPVNQIARTELRVEVTFDGSVSGTLPAEQVVVETDWTPGPVVILPITGQVTDCPIGWVDLNGDPGDGCEYECTFQNANDPPDDNFEDLNCDGIDGEVANAIFVSNSGNDADPGTMDRPKATIQAAITAAAGQGKDVYAAAGTYTGPVTVSNGVSIYGGYDDTTEFWTRSNTAMTTITGSSPVLVASNINTATTVDRLNLQAQNASQPGDSSTAAVALNSGALTIRRCTIQAGTGAPGGDGGNGTPGSIGQPGGSGGQGYEYDCHDAGLCALGCSLGSFICNSAPAVPPPGGGGGQGFCSNNGGTGGAGGYSTQSGQTGGVSQDGTPGGGGGGVESDGVPGTGGSDGGNGGSGTGGANFGSINTGTGDYIPSGATGGQAGTKGTGGGGGGGGGGDDPDLLPDPACCESFGGGGAGGGGGGCGGGGGTDGGGGGGSFGIVAHNSNGIVIEHNTITTATGGGGGDGGSGASGGTGGRGNPAWPGTYNTEDPGETSTGTGAVGGDGGDGGSGGHGGGGGGGPSVCVLLSTTTVSGGLGTNTLTPGSGGSGGTSPQAGANGQPGLSTGSHNL